MQHTRFPIRLRPTEAPMPVELARAHQRFLRLSGPRRPRSDAGLLPPTEIEVAQAARTFFSQVLEPGGAYQGGPLFGHRREGVITIEYTALSGYTCWQTGEHQPLEVDERYVLGLTDAFQASHPDPIDWVGHWLIYSHSELPDQHEALAWFDRAATTRLVDDDHCLLLVGWQEGRLSAQAYVNGETRHQMVVLPHNLGGSGSVVLP